MKKHSIKNFTLGSGIALGLVMLALTPSASFAAQPVHRLDAHRSSVQQSFVQPGSFGYGFAAGPARNPGLVLVGDPINTQRDGGVNRP
jgi:hypothetical protein